MHRCEILKTEPHLAFDAADRLLKYLGEARVGSIDAYATLKFSVVVEHECAIECLERPRLNRHRMRCGRFVAMGTRIFAGQFREPNPYRANRSRISWRTMHILSRRTHGILDYIVGILLIFAPNIFGFANGGAEQRVAVILGIAILIYSLLTNYEVGLFKLISFRAHLTLDVIGGLILAVSPWIFQFSERVWAPHLVVGLLEVGAVLMTRTAASERAPGSPAHP